MFGAPCPGTARLKACHVIASLLMGSRARLSSANSATTFKAGQAPVKMLPISLMLP
jgi:hypothetical protein